MCRIRSERRFRQPDGTGDRRVSGDTRRVAARCGVCRRIRDTRWSTDVYPDREKASACAGYTVCIRRDRRRGLAAQQPLAAARAALDRLVQHDRAAGLATCAVRRVDADAPDAPRATRVARAIELRELRIADPHQAGAAQLGALVDQLVAK